MSRLPPQLQPLWPLAKRGHRAATRAVGALTRRTRRPGDPTALPSHATTSVEQTRDAEPDAVVVHPGGPAEQLQRPMPVGTPADHWVFAWRSSYDVPRRFVLEVADGTVVGDYAATVTPGGVLDFETSGYFGISGWREHPIYLRRRLPEPEPFDGTLVSLAAAGTSGNYFHFVTDALPRWGVLQECLSGLRIDALHLPSGSRYQRELIGLLGLDDIPRIEPSPSRAVRATRLLVPALPNPDLMAPTWTMRWLKAALPPERTTGLPTRLYLTRGQARNTRRLVDEEAHLRVLEKRGFTVFDPGAHTVREQIDHFAAAEAIVAPHGAALTNLAFASPGLRLLELFAPAYVNPCYWTMTCGIPDARYRYLVGAGRVPRRGAQMNGVLTDIRLDPAQLAAAVDDLLA